MEFIRKNNTAVAEVSEKVSSTLSITLLCILLCYINYLLLKVLEFYQKELLPVESFDEFCDVTGKMCTFTHLLM